MQQVFRRFSGMALAVAAAIGLCAVVMAQAGNMDAACVSNAAKLAAAMQMYAVDYDETFPPIDNTAATRNLLLPYTRGDSTAFVCPATNLYFVLNKALSRKALFSVGSDPELIRIFTDAQPHADGKATAAFFDGHIERGGVDPTPPDVACEQNVKRLATALHLYAQDYDEYLPPMHTAAALETALYGYTRNTQFESRRVFLCPETRLSYTYNAALSGRSINDFTANADATEFLRDTHRHADGNTTRAFLSARTSRTPARDWQAGGMATGSDNKSRVLWNHTNGAVSLHTLSPSGVSEGYTEYGPFEGWRAVALATGAADNRTRLLWRHANNAVSLWTLSPSAAGESYVQYGPFEGWQAAALAVGGDNRTRLLWRHTTGAISLWTLSTDGSGSYAEYGPFYDPFNSWSAVSLAVDAEGRARLLWRHTTGAISLWTLAPDGSRSFVEYGPFPGWTAISVASGGDNKTRLLWRHTSGMISLWMLAPDGSRSFVEHGPFPGWTAMTPAVSSDGKTRLLWSHTGGAISLWTLSPAGNLESYVQHGPF